MSILLTLKSNQGLVELHEKVVRIIPKGFFALKQEKEISIADITDVWLKPAGWFANGFIQFLLREDEVPCTSLLDAVKNEYTMVFTIFHNEEAFNMQQKIRELQKNQEIEMLSYSTKKSETTQKRKTDYEPRRGKPVFVVQYPKDNNLITKNFVAFDLETTGLYYSFDEIIEIGAVKVIAGKVADTFSQLINPGIKIPSEASSINGISDRMVENEPPINEVLPDFINFFGDLPLVAHNASFDMNFLIYNMLVLGYEIPKNKVVDTLQIYRRVFPGFENYKLATISKTMNIKHVNKHRGFSDAEAVAHIYLCSHDKLIMEQQEIERVAAEQILKKNNVNKEVEHFRRACNDVIRDILSQNAKDLTYVRAELSTTYFDVKAFYSFARMKISTKSKYLLVDEDIESLKQKFPDFYIEVGTKSENNRSRIRLNSPEDLWMLKDMILEDYDKAIIGLNHYISNTKIGQKNLDLYLMKPESF